jgi:hypothetical protein
MNYIKTLVFCLLFLCWPYPTNPPHKKPLARRSAACVLFIGLPPSLKTTHPSHKTTPNRIYINRKFSPC